MAKMTLFEMKQNLHTLRTEKAAIAEYVLQKSADPDSDFDEIQEKNKKMDELDKRIAIVQKMHDEEVELQRKQVASNPGSTDGMTQDAVHTKAKADFFRAAMTGGNTAKAYEGLGGIPAVNADLGSGSNLLPKNVSNELLLEPLEENPLRTVEPVTNVTGLEEHKLIFSIDDEDLEDVTDKETAKEIELEGDTVVYGRYKTKIKATVKDTIVYGSDHDLVTEVENALRSGLAIKEKRNAFNTNPDEEHAHMSFYQKKEGQYVIKSVTRANIIKAITAAWADLPEMFAGNARVVMRKTDFYDYINSLSKDDNLFGKKPEEILGIPVVFCDRAAIPVVGDFRYSKQNYDIGTVYDADKDVDKGEFKFVLTAWGDHRIRLKSAFRLALVDSSAQETPVDSSAHETP